MVKIAVKSTMFPTGLLGHLTRTPERPTTLGRENFDPMIKIVIKSTMISDRTPGAPESDAGAADHTRARDIWLNI